MGSDKNRGIKFQIFVGSGPRWIVMPNLVSSMQVPWSPPDLGLLKLNFDGSCVRERGLAGYIIRNEFGETRISFLSQFQTDL